MIDGAIWAVPFDDKKYECGISKSGDSYVHKKIWKAIKPKKCRYSYNYYPRGRVEITLKGSCVIYMNPNIGEQYTDEIMKKFGLSSVPKIIYDNSSHYIWIKDGKQIKANSYCRRRMKKYEDLVR